jgi:hypothetical protein
MAAIQAEALPSGALLEQYRDSGSYTDCFVTEVTRCVSHAEFVQAFYTSWLFKIERWILSWAVRKPSTDAEALELAQCTREKFSAWTVEARAKNQLPMCDFQKRTLSWLMVQGLGEVATTRLYFGSAAMPLRPDGQKDRAFGTAFHLLLGFHKLYARALLRAAAQNLTP